MDLSKAFRILNLTDVKIDNDFEKKAKKQYRKLVSKYHPDIAGEKYNDTMIEISEAYEIVKKFIKTIVDKQLKNSNCSYVIISVEDLVRVYNGEKVKAVDGKEIDREYIKNNDNLSVCCYAEVEYNGYRLEFNSYNKYKLYGDIEVNCDIDVVNMDDEITVKVYCYGKEKELKMKSKSLRYLITLEHNIKIAVIINKKQLSK